MVMHCSSVLSCTKFLHKESKSPACLDLRSDRASSSPSVKDSNTGHCSFADGQAWDLAYDVHLQVVRLLFTPLLW